MEQYKILIIDDLIENLKIMVSIFEEYLPQYEIFQTNNSEKAVDIATRVNPNLIITDWDMPGLTGIELIQILKGVKETKDIPVIMATGVMLSPNDLKIAFEAGAIDYVRKPIEPVELIARTNSALLITKYYRQLIDKKDQSLTESALYLVKIQEHNAHFANKLDLLKEVILEEPKEAIRQINQLKDDVKEQIDEEGWYRFNLSFSDLHKDFTKTISETHPSITPAELKLCSFIRLGMANKEIASVLNQSPDSIKVSSYRIRKKFGLTGGVNLRSYLSQF